MLGINEDFEEEYTCDFNMMIEVALQKIIQGTQTSKGCLLGIQASCDGEESIYAFITEVIGVFDIEINAIIYSYVLLSRLCITKREQIISQSNIYTIIYIAIIISTKMLQDNPLVEEELGYFIGIATSQLSMLEAQFLESLDYNVFVNEDLFQQYRNLII